MPGFDQGARRQHMHRYLPTWTLAPDQPPSPSPSPSPTPPLPSPLSTPPSRHLRIVAQHPNRQPPRSVQPSLLHPSSPRSGNNSKWGGEGGTRKRLGRQRRAASHSQQRDNCSRGRSWLGRPAAFISQPAGRRPPLHLSPPHDPGAGHVPDRRRAAGDFLPDAGGDLEGQ